MMELANLRAHIATLKAAPIFGKAELAEKTIDAMLLCLVVLDRRLSQLEERAGQQNGD